MYLDHDLMNMEKRFPVGSLVVRVGKDNTSKYPIGTLGVVIGYSPPTYKVALRGVDDWLEGESSVPARAWSCHYMMSHIEPESAPAPTREVAYPYVVRY